MPEVVSVIKPVLPCVCCCSLETGPDPHGGPRGPGMNHGLPSVDTLGLRPVTECGEFALKRPAGLGLGGVEDGSARPEMSTVSIEQLVDTDGVVGAQSGAVDSMGNLAGKVLLGAVVGALLHLAGSVVLQAGVEARVG